MLRIVGSAHEFGRGSEAAQTAVLCQLFGGSETNKRQWLFAEQERRIFQGWAIAWNDAEHEREKWVEGEVELVGCSCELFLPGLRGAGSLDHIIPPVSKP